MFIYNRTNGKNNVYNVYNVLYVKYVIGGLRPRVRLWLTQYYRIKFYTKLSI